MFAEEWDPSSETDASQEPVPMIINSGESQGSVFEAQGSASSTAEAAARGNAREALVCAGLRGWDATDSSYMWMTTLSSGHGVSDVNHVPAPCLEKY